MAASVSSLEGSLGRDDNLERLFKTFTFKCLQVIIHSRNEANILRSNRESNEYFSVSIPDNPAIEELLKKSLEDVKSFPPKSPICVEVALVTSEGDHMFLETWDLSFNTSSLDMSANRIQHIFTRMGVTLKSLLSSTRVLPAFKLARNQGEKGGGYKLTHRIYTGKPQTHMLGDGFKTVRAGAVPTAHGLLTITVSYRTKLLLSTEMSSPVETAIEVNENHFMKEAHDVKKQNSPRTSKPLPCLSPIKSPDGRPESPYCFAVSPSSLEKEDNAMRARAEAESLPWTKSSILQMDEIPEPVMGAFSRQQQPVHRFSEPEVPFEGLMRKSFLARHEPKGSDKFSEGFEGQGPYDKHEDEKENIPRELAARNVFGARKANLEEEYVMVDRPPFAEEDDPGDVKAFLSTMLRAPKLYDNCTDGGSDNESYPVAGKTGSPSVLSVGQYLSDVGDLVTRLEEDMPVLDEFCNSVINMSEREEDEEEDANDGGITFFS
ncbi:autophagy-related protein 13 [Plakobranchus ocellatus]|uniref:Autophagy-related protein 13 n=1 Tax=Plakobranchus ocellatus TaxID=259542 RepID=A0AAV4DTN4_9GAST|nr:autophagy-related protein 13 [Plakobranchus ocellatus]